MPVVERAGPPHIVVMIRETTDPLELFAAWYGEAATSEPNDPSAMALATVLEPLLIVGNETSGTTAVLQLNLSY